MALDKVFVALDQMDRNEIEDFMKFSDFKFKNIKIGLELFLKYGPQIISELHTKYQCQIFLDLKLHDIPVTIQKSIQSLENLPIKFLTIHLTGGKEMIEAALEAQQKYLPHCTLLGVSFLTSLESKHTESMFGMQLDENAFGRLFTLAKATHLKGVVCSPNEAKLLKQIAPEIISVTPGIRFKSEIMANENIGDQKRIMPFELAFDNQCDFVVMGRSLTKCKSKEILDERIKIISTI